MLILLTIFLFIFTAFAMLILRVLRPRLSIQGFVVVLAVLSGLPMVFLARSDIPHIIQLLQWKPDSLFPLSPSLLIDKISWDFALALTTLSFSVVITSITQLGQSKKIDLFSVQNQTHGVETSTTSSNTSGVKISPAANVSNKETGAPSNWLLWAAILIITSMGLLAVTAGNILTLLLTWAALDITELIVMLSQGLQSGIRERIILVFSAKMAGIVTLLVAGLTLWSLGDSLSFDAISPSISIYLILAAGIRLGVLPFQLPFTQELPINRGLGTVLRLVPAASSYILLVRVSATGVNGAITPYLVVFTTMAGLFAAINWMHAKDELNGRPYWLLGTASLAVGAAILNQPVECSAWSIASLLSGGFIFSMSLRHRNLIPLVLLGMVNLSSLPFTPTWQGTRLYQYSSTFAVNLSIFSLFSILFLLIQAFLLAGFIRHSLRGIYPSGEEISEHIERWVWFLYPCGLILMVVTHLFIGLEYYPNLNGLPLYWWIIGPIVLIITGLILYITWRYPQSSSIFINSRKPSFWNNLFSLDWLYRLLWQLFRGVSNLISLFSAMLEGEGGILWALVLFALIFVFLQR